MKKNTLCIHSFDIDSACWMQNSILHPTSIHTRYFWQTPLPQKQEIHEKNVMMMSSSRFFKYPHCILLTDSATPKTRNTWKNVMMTSSSRFFHVFLVFGVVGSVKSMHCGYSLEPKLNSTSNELSLLKFE